MKSFTNKVAFVTGASTGISYALAEAWSTNTPHGNSRSRMWDARGIR